MIIPAGKYPVPERRLAFDLRHGLAVSEAPACYLVTGANGYGKTTFLEKVVIAALQKEGLPFFYLGQDIRTQLYTLRALLSVRGAAVSGVDDARLIEMWIGQSGPADVFLLDEYDKYLPDLGFIFRCCDAFIRTYFIVSHLDPGHIRPDAGKFRLGRLHFDLKDFDGTVKTVRIQQEDPWPR